MVGGVKNGVKSTGLRMKKQTSLGFDLRPHIATAAICTALSLAVIWQGSFFTVQYIILLAIPFAAFAFSERSVTVTLNTLLFVGLTLVMLASLLIAAKEPQIGIREWLRYLLMPIYLQFFIVFKDKSKWYMKAFFIGIATVAIFGILAYFGGIEIPFGIIEQSGRMQSTIQYANTTALLMLIGVLYSTHYFQETRNWRYPLYAVGFAYCLYLTGSRTTFILLFAIALMYTISRLKLKARLISIGILAATAAAFLLIGGRIVRISLTEPTFIERVITWQDGLALAMQNPFFGLGIGNWQFEQFLYQSAPYGVRYIHNYYVQLALDGGVLAMLIFAAALANSLWRGRKERSIHLFAILAIALHIFMDFDMSFGAVILILMFSLAQVPDKEIKLFTFQSKRLRFLALAPAIFFAVIWVAEFNRIPPDPLDAKFAVARQLAAEGEYITAIEYTEELIRLWRFNEEYQVFYRKLLVAAVAAKELSDDEQRQKLMVSEQSSTQMNPLYIRYIKYTN